MITPVCVCVWMISWIQDCVVSWWLPFGRIRVFLIENDRLILLEIRKNLCILRVNWQILTLTMFTQRDNNSHQNWIFNKWFSMMLFSLFFFLLSCVRQSNSSVVFKMFQFWLLIFCFVYLHNCRFSVNLVWWFLICIRFFFYCCWCCVSHFNIVKGFDIIMVWLNIFWLLLRSNKKKIIVNRNKFESKVSHTLDNHWERATSRSWWKKHTFSGWT